MEILSNVYMIMWRDSRGGPGTLIRSLSGYHSALQPQVGRRGIKSNSKHFIYVSRFYHLLLKICYCNNEMINFFYIKMVKL